jgi:extracellular elastinolytic metalloproteinase
MAKKRTAQKTAAKRVRKSVRKAAPVRRARDVAAPPDPIVSARGAEPPNRDGRQHVPANFHALYDRGFRAARGLPPAPPPAARAASASRRRMARTVPDLEIHYDETTQLPNMIVTKAPAATLTAPARAAVRRRAAAARTPESAAMQFIRSRGDLWQLSAADAETIEVVSVSEPEPPPSRAAAGRRGARRAAAASFDISPLKTVNLIQRVEGVEVFNSDTTAAVNTNNDVIALAGHFFAGAASTATRSRASRRGVRGRAAAAAPTLTPAEDAIARAAFDLTNTPYTAADFSRAPDPPDGGSYRFYEYTASSRDPRPTFERPVRVKDVMFPLGDGQFVPGYYIELFIKGFPAFSYVMDAIDTPDLLYRKNLTSHVTFQYRVHNTGDALFRPEDGPAPGTPHPTGKPDGFQAKPITEKLITVESLLSGDPWLPAGATTTEGNNCIAYADLAAPDGFGPGDVKGAASAPGVFDYTYNHKKASTDPTNLQNSLVGMFFHVNWLHDRWYEAGFDEASGNAQKSNFGRGGLGGDPMLAEGSDFSGTDNANMSTPADGHSPRMQMYTFTGTNPTRTSNHEALITFHEMGHYVTNRLIGNANGLTNPQGEAMGEGWGDFFALCMTSQSTDNFEKGTFAVGGWTDLTPTFKNNYYFSIRRYPYSADMKKNPLTFKHIGNNVVLPTGPPINPSPAGNNEVHNAGEVWCSALWEVFVNLVAKHKHELAEKRMLAYIIGGLKLTPVRPTYVQARDAIIAAVAALDAGDLPAVKAGFAKRGMGTGAVAPPSNSTSMAGVVESFTP